MKTIISVVFFLVILNVTNANAGYFASFITGAADAASGNRSTREDAILRQMALDRELDRIRAESMFRQQQNDRFQSELMREHNETFRYNMRKYN